MSREDVKIGMYCYWKGDIEESGRVRTLPDRDGYVDIEGPDTERGPQDFNVHYSDLEED